jgi:hypothetical protein
MNNMNEAKNRRPDFLRMEEMRELIAAEENKITRDLMTFAFNCFASVIIKNTAAPIADFDMKFSMQVVHEFAKDHEGLQMFLDGKGDEEGWGLDDDS